VAVKKFDLEDVQRLLRECGGEVPSADLTAFADSRFDELGYDSLAILELTVRIENQYGVRIGDEDMAAIGTPADLVQYVTARSMVP
jgi:act minimal PKS acyl carrier protein